MKTYEQYYVQPSRRAQCTRTISQCIYAMTRDDFRRLFKVLYIHRVYAQQADVSAPLCGQLYLFRNQFHCDFFLSCSLQTEVCECPRMVLSHRGQDFRNGRACSQSSPPLIYIYIQASRLLVKRPRNFRGPRHPPAVARTRNCANLRKRRCLSAHWISVCIYIYYYYVIYNEGPGLVDRKTTRKNFDGVEDYSHRCIGAEDVNELYIAAACTYSAFIYIYIIYK